MEPSHLTSRADVAGATSAQFSVTLEAESASRSNGARLVLNSTVVDHVGRWCTGWRCDPGVVSFSVGQLAAGSYTVTVHYVFVDRSSDEQRWARVELRRSGGGTSYLDGWYSRCTSTCTKAFTSASLNQGSYTFRFVNDGGRAPAIDKIVITKNP